MRSARLFAASLLVCVAGACTLLTDLDGLSGPALAADGGREGAALGDGGVDAPALDSAADVDAGSAYAAAVLVDHPVVYLRLGDRTPEVAKNERPGGSGTYSGNVTTVAQPGLIVGDPNTAVKLAGSGRVRVPAVRGLFLGLSPFSIELWLAIDQLVASGAVQWLLGCDDVDNPRFGVSLIVDNQGVSFERWVKGVNRRISGQQPRVAAPSHIVATYDGAAIQLWVDGTPTSVLSTDAGMPDNTYPIIVGAQSSELNAFLRGTVDELALYDYVLPPARIAAHLAVGTGK